MGDAFAVGYALARHLIQEGHEKIGLCLEALPQKTRLKAGVTAGCESLNAKGPVCFHIPGHDDKHAPDFLQWFRKERPAAIITTDLATETTLESAGFKIPEDISLFHWNISSHHGRFSGWDQDNIHLGAAAVDQVIGQIHRAEKGIPVQPTIINSTGRFVQGTTSNQRADSHHSWRHSYPAAEKATDAAWRCLDFNEAQNSNYERDWPFALTHFPPAKRDSWGSIFDYRSR